MDGTIPAGKSDTTLRVVGTPGSSEGSKAEAPTRRHILEATLKLLGEKGYPGVTTDLIAARAKVSKASIYRFWASKQELIVDAARLLFHAVEVPDMGSFEHEISFALESRMQDYRHPGTLRLVASLVGAAATDPVLEDAFENWVERFDMSLRRIIQRGIARGDVRPDVDTYVLESLIAGAIARGIITQRALSPIAIEHVARLLTVAVAPSERP
jgi:AcrR family transcriptional regulator